MSTVNFSVPEDIKQAFNTTFAGRNKSAIVAELLREAVQREEDRQASRAAIDSILEARRTAPVRSAKALDAARKLGRP